MIEMHNRDCMELMAEYPDNHFDLAIVDPPYGIDYQSAWRIERKRKKKILNDSRPYVEWVKPLYDKLNKGGAVICFYRYDVQNAFYTELSNVGFDIKGQIVWDKVIHGMGDLSYGIAPQHELALYATKGRRPWLNGRPKSIITSQRTPADDMIHPNEKPVRLYKLLLSRYAREFDKVVDLFGGSGSICIACHDMGFDLTWTELDEEHYKAAVKRLNQHKAQLTLNI